MDIFVHLEETFEDLFALILGDTATGVLAIDVQTIVLDTIAQFDMALMGIFHGICEEIGDNLTYATIIDGDEEGIVGIIYNELYGWFADTLFERLAEK